jgi:hypothetical protein
MTHTAASANKAIVGLAAAAVVSATFVASALSCAPPAQATCASFSGINLGSGCSSTLGGFAIAIGPSVAIANGFLSTAIAVGNDATAGSFGALSFAVAAGHSQAIAGESDNDFANIAISLGDDSFAQSGRIGGGGFGNVATNIGNGNLVNALGVLNNAFAVFSTNVAVSANPGPLAVAGSIGQSNVLIEKDGPGFNINGIKVGGAAAPARATAHVHSASAAYKTPTGKTAPAANGKKKAATSAGGKSAAKSPGE